MVWQSRQQAVSLAVLVTGLLPCAATQATYAADTSYCVTCKNPDQTYLCQVNAGGSRPSDALKLYCIIRTAKEGQHGSCSAERISSGCNGVMKVYSYDGPMPEDVTSDPRIKKFTDKLERERKVFEQPKGDQPKTLVELGGRAVSASRQGLRNARSRFGGSSQEINQSLPDEALSYDPAPVPPAAESAPPPAPDLAQSNRAQRASSAVGGFARKSYRCVASLFRRCTEPPADDVTLR
jgi:hypothetical protein